MSTLPVAHYLRDLGSEQGRGRALSPRAELSPAKSAELAAAVEEARARGALEGRAAAEKALAVELVQERLAAEERLKAERQRWTSEESERLTGQLQSALREMEVRFSEQVARILKPVLRAEAARRAVAGMMEAFDGLLSKGEFIRVEVSGPEDLLEQMRAHLAGKVANAIFHASPGCDLRITADETVLETRIGAWALAIDGERE